MQVAEQGPSIPFWNGESLDMGKLKVQIVFYRRCCRKNTGDNKGRKDVGSLPDEEVKGTQALSGTTLAQDEDISVDFSYTKSFGSQVWAGISYDQAHSW